MKNILIYSIPFGYGPTGKAIAIANELAHIHNVTIVTFNHSLEIVEKNSSIKIIDCKSRIFSEWDTDIFSEIDILISVMDLRLINFTATSFPQIKTVFVDSLFWWRQTLDDFPFEDCDMFLLQTFPGVSEKINTIPAVYRSKFYEVSPIVSNYKINAGTTGKSKNIMLNFGGVNSLIAEWTMYVEYFEFIIERTLSSIQTFDFKVIVAGNNDLMKHLNNKFAAYSNISFECLVNKRFHESLNSSHMLLSTCGIEATYEAYFYKIPTIFLPPVNSTQLYQLKSFISKEFPVVISVNLLNSFNKVIEASLDYPKQTMQIANTLKETIRNSGNRHEMGNQIYHYITCVLDKDYRRELIIKQNKFFRSAPHKWRDVLTLIELGISEKL